MALRIDRRVKILTKCDGEDAQVMVSGAHLLAFGLPTDQSQSTYVC